MKNSGFTLVELLGTIVILSIIVIIITITVDTTISNSKKKLSKVQIANVEEAAEVYYLKEGIKNYSLDDESFEMCVNLEYLINNDYIENEEIKNLKNSNKLEGSVKIKYESESFIYKYQEKSCNFEYVSLDKICKPVTEDTKTTGNVPKGDLESGDEYICEVKPGTEYHFFLLSKEDDGTVNLIMNRNICEDGTVATENNICFVNWFYEYQDSNSGENNNSYGPVTAMNYLHNATKDWNNIPNIIINYEDENIDYDTQEKGTGGFGSIKTVGTTTIITNKSAEETGRIENLKARLPKYNEVVGTRKCTLSNGSCPLWLSNFFRNSSYITGEDLQNIEGIDGYWIFSSEGSYSNSWGVGFYGTVFTSTVNFDYVFGVRPVINVKLDGSAIPKPKSFAEDSWDTIAANVRAGNLSKYKIGNTKEITLTSDDEEIAGTYTVRIANTLTPSECKTSGFSQTACGFVIEFVDIITKHEMYNVGGWESSEMRTYVNNEIYNAFPEELRKNIKETYVVSGHESGKTENYKTTDKVYLLSTKEIWGKGGTSNIITEDTAEEETRQLDYYKSIGVTTNNYSGTIKNYNESSDWWWLRSPFSSRTNNFYSVNDRGDWNAPITDNGVSPAFRL